MKKRTLDEMSYYVEQAKKNVRSKIKDSLLDIMMDAGYAAYMNRFEMIDVAEVLYEYAKDFRNNEDLEELKNEIRLWKNVNKLIEIGL